MNGSGSALDHRGSSSLTTQVNGTDNVYYIHEPSPTNVPTSSGDQTSDDGDSPRTNHLISVTSFAQGATPAISSFSKDLRPTTVLTDETQSDDTSSTYRLGFTDRRQVIEKSKSVNLQSSVDHEGGSRFAHRDVTSIDQRAHAGSIAVDGVGSELTPRIIPTTSVDLKLNAVLESDSRIIINSQSGHYFSDCTNGHSCNSLLHSDLPDASSSTVTSHAIYHHGIVISPTSVVESTALTDSTFSINEGIGGDYSSLSGSADYFAQSDYFSEGTTLNSISDIYPSPVTQTVSIQASEYLTAFTLSTEIQESFHVPISSLDTKESSNPNIDSSSVFLNNLSIPSDGSIYSHPYSIGVTKLNIPYSYNSSQSSKGSDHSYWSGIVNQRVDTSIVSATSVISETWSIDPEVPNLRLANSSTTSSTKTALDSSDSTMTELMPSQTSSLGTVSSSRDPSSSTPHLSQPVFESSDVVKPSATSSSPFTQTVTDYKPKDIKKTLVSSHDLSEGSSTSIPSFSDPSITATPGYLSPSPAPHSKSASPPLITDSTQGSDNVNKPAMDPGFLKTTSSSNDMSSFEVQPSSDVPASIEPKSSSRFHVQSSQVKPSPRSAIITVTPTFEPSVWPSASVTGDGQTNGTYVPPGKVDTDNDGFMTGHGPIIVGSACGVFIVGVVIIIALLCALRRKRTKKPPKRDPRVDDVWVDIDQSDGPLPLPSTNTCLDWYDNQLAVVSDQLYQATRNYASKQDGYLTLAIGDLLRINEVSDNGWWRGITVKDGTTGWFPADYVTEFKDDGYKREDLYPGTMGDVSLDVHHQVSSFQIKKLGPEDTKPLVKENVANHGTLQSKDFKDDVASWVKMSSSVSMTSLRSIDTIGTCSTMHEDSFTVKGFHFRAIYSYKPVCKGEMGLKEGELVVCKERDRNGWMLGIKPRTKEEGWFPAVYVDEVSPEDPSLREEDIPLTYDLLDSNKLHNPNQKWTGIEHKALRSFVAEVPGDLNFQCDDVIIVYQTLANGWWFGSKDKYSGWFPGAYVEMIEDKSETNELGQENGKGTTPVTFNPANPLQKDNDGGDSKQTLPINDISPLKKSPLSAFKLESGHQHDSSNFFSFSSTNSPQGSIASSVASDNDMKPLVSPKPATMESQGRFKKNVRPNRKAPAPPMALHAKTKDFMHPDGTSSMRRPVRRAPAPPTRQHSKEESDMKRSGTLSVKDIFNPPPFKKPLYLINGKSPKLVKISPDIFDEKCLNPMIRPATRGLAPVLLTHGTHDSASPGQHHGPGGHKLMRNGHDVERRVKTRSNIHVHARNLEHRLSSVSRASYGSNTDTVTSDYLMSEYRNSPLPDNASSLSRCSTPTILHAQSTRSGKTLTRVSPPMVPMLNGDDLPFPDPPPPLEEYLSHQNYVQNTAISPDTPGSLPMVMNSFVDCQVITPVDSNECVTPTNNTAEEEFTVEETANQTNGNQNQHLATVTVPSTSHLQKTPPSTLPKPRINGNKSPLGLFSRESRQQSRNEAEETVGNKTEPSDVQRRPSEVSRTGAGSPPIRESFALIPGKVSDIVHHLNSLSPQSAFPPIHDGAELSLIIPQRKQSADNHMPTTYKTKSPSALHNGHDSDYTDQSYNNYLGTTKEVAHDLTQINKDILEKNTFVPISDNLQQIEDRVSTFRSLPRPSRKSSKDRVSLTLASDGDQSFPFFKPTSFEDKVTEL